MTNPANPMFRAGQDVICIEGHPDPNGVKKDVIYTINEVLCQTCGCGINFLVDVGITDYVNTVGHNAQCQGCQQIVGKHDGKWWFSEKRFAPLQTLGEEVDLEESLREIFEKKPFEL